MLRNRLMQLFRDNVDRGQGFRIEAAADEATIYLYAAIGSYFGIDPQEFVKELSAIKAGTIHLRINSPGGDVFDARAIQTALYQHPARIITHIDGLAASAASFVALAGNEIEMAQGAELMIHRAWALQIGNSEEMLQMADLLDKIDESIVADYARKTKAENQQIKDWMAAETWFSAQEALDNGFIDRIYEAPAPENKFNLSAFDNVPDRLKQKEGKEEAEVADYRAHLERRLALIDSGI